MGETVEIVKLGHAGDGIAADGLFVPYTVPGDVVRVTREGTRGRVEEIIVRGPARIAAPCRHFGACGGCALQMMESGAYLAWKRDLVMAALKQRGFEDAPVEDIRAVAPGTRRRASFKALKGWKSVQIGFYAPASQTLIDVEECPVLVPPLVALLQPLRNVLMDVLKMGEKSELHATMTDSGVDLTIRQKRARKLYWLIDLAAMAQSLKLARLSWNDGLIAMNIQPIHHVGRFTIALPPESFLQPTREGERILQDLVRAEIGGASRVADLFSGCGTFTFILAEKCAVHAADGDAAHVAALEGAAKQSRAQVTAETRDLFRRPFAPEELTRFDAVLLDPPRVGAQAQAGALARSKIPRILYVSCNPASFARDARILSDGGYRLSRVVPLDQFLWSPHVEIFAVFNRS